MTRYAFVLAIALAVVGCASAPTHYYSLIAPDHPGAGPKNDAVRVVVDSVTVPELVDRMQLVEEESDTRVRILEHERWAAPLRDQITAVLISQLRDALDTYSVLGGSQLDGRTHSIHLNVDVERFEARKNGFTLTTARWQVLGCNAVPDAGGFARVSQPLADDTPDGIVHAWSENLQNLSKEIAGFIRKTCG